MLQGLKVNDNLLQNELYLAKVLKSYVYIQKVVKITKGRQEPAKLKSG